MDALAFLEEAADAKPQPVYVLHGDEDFLKRQVLIALRSVILGPDGSEFGLSTHAGDVATWAAVCDELETLPFLSPRRVVVVEAADPFVTRHRPALEKYVTQPAATGVLVLEVKSWPGNTRISKLVPGPATIACKAPAPYKLPDWCVQWADSRHGKQIAPGAARLLVDLVGPEMGQLDQELAKLAIYVGEAPRIETGDVDKLVGSSRGANTFKIFDALAEGRPGDALAILDNLFDHGEEPIRILGAFSLQLRRLAQVARLSQQGRTLTAAMDEIGIPPFARQQCERQLRHLGPGRLACLYDWLLELDLGLKGSSQLPPRLLLERLLACLA
jgi:DNA polymerase-3 subunit delta